MRGRIQEAGKTRGQRDTVCAWLSLFLPAATWDMPGLRSGYMGIPCMHLAVTRNIERRSTCLKKYHYRESATQNGSV